MQIVGHRGAAGLAPENTLAAIRAGLKAGVDWIEFDVRATRDGRIILMHDKSLRRVNGARKLVSRLNYAELKRYKAGGQAIPTLAEALSVIDGQAKVVIEIKSAGCAEAVVRAIEHKVRAGAKYSDFMIGSFKVRFLREARWLNDQIPLVLFQFTNPYRFLNLKHLPLHTVGFHHRVMPRGAIRQAKLHGYEVYAYTVNSPVAAKRMAKLGVDGVATNYPDRLKDLA